MAMVSEPETLNRTIVETLRKHLGQAWQSVDIAEDVELHSLGLDSMKSISLLLDLESAFAITFPDELLAPENYRTLNALRTMVAAALNK